MKQYRELLVGCFAALLLTTTFNSFGQPFASTNAPPWQGGQDTPAYAPGEVLVKFADNVTDEEIATAFRGARLQLVKQIRTQVMRDKGDIGITRALTAMPVEAAAALLKQFPGIDYAEPNWVYRHQAVPNDTLFSSLWGMLGDATSPANQYGSQAAEAWAAGYIGSPSVVVGIIDEGFQFTHPDLNANVWTNPFDPVDGVDNDGNGYVDDIHGWDFYQNNNTIYDDTGDDHGTHVAGTIGAVGGNNTGVVGINWAVSMISGKFLGPNGGDTADAIEAVDYFTALKTRTLKPVNIVALNNSWGGGGYSQGLHDAIIRAAKAGILFVAAAGNGNWAGRAINTDSSPNYPSCYDTTKGTLTESAATYDAVIAVTAIDSKGGKPSWANYGAKTVDLGAPGVGINSTLPIDSYGFYDGTSMATPHVTGAIALYASTHPDESAAQIKSAILSSAKSTSSLSGKTVTGGRLDLSTVITPPSAPSVPPAAPSGLVAQAISFSSIQLTWADNSNNENRFEITRSVQGSSTSVTLTVGGDCTSFTDSGLNPSTTYSYTIQACNSLDCTPSAGPAVSAKTLAGPAAAIASFAGSDAVTQGTWNNVYGKDGYWVYRYSSPGTYKQGDGNAVSLVSGTSANTWGADGTTDPRAVQAPNSSYRFADCQYGSSFTVDIDLTAKRRVSFYFLDWDSTSRAQTIQIIDVNYPSVPLDTRQLASFHDGRYLAWDLEGHVQVKITCAGGANAVLSAIFFDAAVDRSPTVSITSVTPVVGGYTIVGTAGDDFGIKQVEFFASNFSLGFGTRNQDGTWAKGWTPPGDGGYTLTAVATDTADQRTTSAPYNFIVDTIPPTVSITSPVDKANVSGLVTVTATANDAQGVTKVEFYAGGAPIGTDAVGSDGWSVTWDTSTVLNGNYDLIAKAFDTKQSADSSAVPVTVTVANTVATTMHCGDLDATKASSGKTWKATVSVTIHNTNHQPVEGASVTGDWGGGSGTLSAQTDSSGKAIFTIGSVPKTTVSITFTIKGVTRSGLTYDPTTNHDPDGDSDGTSIIVTKP